jgi:hypothetical protein
LKEITMRNLALLLVVFALGITGCSTTKSSSSTTAPTQDLAKVVLDTSNSQRHLSIEEASNQPAKGFGETIRDFFSPISGKTEVWLSPGDHVLKMICRVGNTEYKGQTQFTAEANKVYTIKVSLQGYRAIFRVEDENSRTVSVDDKK